MAFMFEISPLSVDGLFGTHCIPLFINKVLVVLTYIYIIVLSLRYSNRVYGTSLWFLERGINLMI